MIIVIIIIKAQNVKIGIFPDFKIQALSINILEGKYLIHSDSIENIIEVEKQNLYISIVDKDFITVIINKDTILKRLRSFYLKSNENNSRLKLNFQFTCPNECCFYGNFLFKVDTYNIKIINEIDLEKYVEGVVEAETGFKAEIELYKAQAIIARTYCLANLKRHESEGFNLCNRPHCQVYYGIQEKNSNIFKAVNETKGLILTDYNGIPINAVYHANCGGMTCDASYVWQKSEPYLKSIVDPFCEDFKWSVKVNVSQWKNFLKQNNIKYINKPINFVQEKRFKNFDYYNNQIQLTKIREAFNLKSTYFSINQHGSYLIFKGRGHGHGVGMCQHGAMAMARAGYTFIDILHFYFQNVDIRSLDNIQALANANW